MADESQSTADESKGILLILKFIPILVFPAIAAAISLVAIEMEKRTSDRAYGVAMMDIATTILTQDRPSSAVCYDKLSAWAARVIADPQADNRMTPDQEKALNSCGLGWGSGGEGGGEASTDAGGGIGIEVIE